MEDIQRKERVKEGRHLEGLPSPYLDSTRTPQNREIKKGDYGGIGGVFKNPQTPLPI